MEIRKAGPEDVEAMKELWKEFIDYHKEYDRFFSRTIDGDEKFGNFVIERINSKDWLVMVAVMDDQIVGHLLATIQEYPPVYEKTQYGYIQDIAVTPKYRRHNIGTEFVNQATGWFKERGVFRIELDAAATNPISPNFWRKMGFHDFMIRMWKSI